MPIEVLCDDCGNKYKVNDDKAGSRIRCKECGAKIEVPDGDDDGEVFSRVSSPRSGGKKRKGSGGPPVGVIIGVGAVAGVLVIGIALFMIMGRGGGQQVAQNPNNGLPNSNPNGVPQPQPIPPGPLPVNALPASNPNTTPSSLPNQSVANNTPAPASSLPNSTPGSGLPSSGGLPMTQPANDAAGGPPAPEVAQLPGGKKFGGFANDNSDNGAANAGPEEPNAPLPDLWNVKVDPGKTEAKIDTSKPLSMRFPKGARHTDILFPVTPSVFVALGQNSQLREVWNLATKAKVGTITDKSGGSEGALSPDGQYLAASLSRGSDGVIVWATKTGKALGELPTNGRVQSIMFANGTRLVAICNDGSAKAWKLPSGDVEHELTVDDAKATPNNASVTPGGNYLAVVADKATLKFFDLNSGEVAGELPLPFKDVFFAGKADAMAFSPDGQELAMVMPTGVFEKVFVRWNVADGKMLTQVDLNVKNLSHAADRAQGNRLEWFPDKSKLLWRGHHVLDAKAGGPVWNAPDEDGSSDAPRELLDAKRILIVTGGWNNPALKTAPVPLDEISASAKVVAEGGEASDAGMPNLAKADTSGALPIPSSAVGPWSMKPDGSPAGKAVKANIPLPKDRTSIGGIYVARPSVGRAAVWYSDHVWGFGTQRTLHRHTGAQLPGGAGSVVIDLFDTATGKLAGTVPIGYPSGVLDVSQDGNFVAVKTMKPNDERIDVYGTNGKHFAGWRPFQQNDGLKGVTNAVLLDGNFCLTSNFNGVVYLWKLPECKAVWRLQSGKNFILSPGGKYLGFQVENRYLFMEAHTGTIVCELPIKMPKFACGFHPTGTHLACLTSDNVSHKVSIIDIATGKPTADFYVPQGNDNVQWCGDADLLLDDKWLVDLKQQKNAWQYELKFGSHSMTQPDGRHWFVSTSAFNDPNAFLSSAVIPEAGTKAKIDAAQLPDETLLKLGIQVGLQVNIGSGHPSQPNLSTEITNNFKAGLERHGFVVAQGAPLTFTVTATQSTPPDKLMKFRGFGPRSINADVNATNIMCEVALLSNGQSAWKHTLELSNYIDGPFGRVYVPEGEEISAFLLRKVWEDAANHLKRFPAPGQVFGGTNGAGLGKSTFVPGGTQ